MSYADMLAREYASEITVQCEQLASAGELPYMIVSITSVAHWLGEDAPSRVRNMWDDAVTLEGENSCIPELKVAANVLDRLHYEINMYASNQPGHSLASPYSLHFNSAMGVCGYHAD